jgi:hypothetical protein
LLEAMFSMRSMSRTYKVSQDKIREEHKFKWYAPNTWLPNYNAAMKSNNRKNRIFYNDIVA